MEETDIIKGEQSQLVDAERLKTELSPVLIRERETPAVSCFGFVSGVGGGLGDSALAMEATASGVKVAVVDGVGNDDSVEITSERLHAETVAAHLVVPDRTVMDSLGQAERELGLKIAKGNLLDPLFCAWGVLEIASAEGEKGGAKMEAFGGGDVTVVAFLDQGKDITDRIVPLYFNPTADHRIDTILSPRFHGLRARELRVPPKSFLPSGTVILLADDGGMDLLLHPLFLRKMGAEGYGLDEAVEQTSRLFRSLRPGEFDEDAVTAGLKIGMKPFFSALSQLGCRRTIDLLMKLLGERRQLIPDDVAMALVVLK